MYSTWEDLIKRQDAIANIGRPDRPEWEGILGSDGKIRSDLQLSDGGLNTGFLDRMREEGMRDAGTQSQWAQIANQQLDQQQLGQRDSLARQQAGQQSQAMNRLAMNGGLRGGAGERMAGRLADQGLLAQQQNARSANDQRLNISAQDEQNRLSNLANLGNAELQVGNYNRAGEQFNIGNTLNDINAKRQFDMNNYNKEMEVWSARKTAEAQPSGGKK